MVYPILPLQEMHLLDHVMAFIICVVAPFVALSSRKMSMEDFPFDEYDKTRLYHSNAMFLFVIGLIMISVWRITGKSMVALGFAPPVWHPELLIILLAILLFYGLDVFFQYGLKKWREKTLSQREGALVFAPSNLSEFFHFIPLAIAAGVGEEIIFRGFLIQYILFWVGYDITGVLFGAVFSSAIFAFLHGYQGFKSIIKIFFLSLLLAALFIISHSLLFVMIIHALIDAMSGGVSAFLLQHASEGSLEDDSD